MIGASAQNAINQLAQQGKITEQGLFWAMMVALVIGIIVFIVWKIINR